jgi:hypothetical protein
MMKRQSTIFEEILPLSFGPHAFCDSFKPIILLLSFDPHTEFHHSTTPSTTMWTDNGPPFQPPTLQPTKKAAFQKQ